MNFLDYFRKQYYPLNVIELSRERVLQNYKHIARTFQHQIAPVLKSNAYGHGLVQIARILDPLGAPFFCVDSLFEAYELLEARIKTPILIMGYIDPKNLCVKKLPFMYAVSDRTVLRAINKFQPQAKVHLCIDTGMHREGIRLEDLPEFLLLAQSLKYITIDGVMSHFADACNVTNPLNIIQIKNFNKAQEILYSFAIPLNWRHIEASSGVLHLRKYSKDLGNVARVGIALYGIAPKAIHTLLPVLRLKTVVGQIKSIKKGETIGYDGAFTAKRDMVIGVLPIGYFDGIDRRLTTKGVVKIGQKECQIIGKVSMNITTVDITNIEDAHVGQEVVIYSRCIEDKNSILSSAAICQTIPHELLIHLSPTIRRVIV